MIRSSLFAALFASLMLATSASATTTIADGYHGGTANNPFWANQDIVGLTEHWDISKMDVTLNASTGEFVVSIYSQFFDNVGRLGIELGDLFISTNGWAPHGTAPYNADDASNGEDWELVAVLSEHGEGHSPDDETGTSFLGKSGAVALYDVIPGNIELSSLPGHDFRVGQEAQYDASQQRARAIGKWAIKDVLNDPYDVLTIAFNFGPDSMFYELYKNFGFHWTMTCGNDVIEGRADVPEPTTMALMGMGLLGMVPRLKRSKK